MELSFLLFQQIIVLFIIMMLGFAIVKTGLLKSRDCEPISTLIVYVVMPCVIIKSFQIEFTKENLHGFIVAAIFAVIIHSIWIPMTHFLGKILHLTSIEKGTLVYSNSGNMIIPLVSALFGDTYVFYACIFNAVQTIFIWTHANSLISESPQRNLKKIIKNPNIIAIIVGVILFFSGIKVPVVLMNTMTSVGNMIGPASMIVIGMLMASSDLKNIIKSAKAYIICLGRLIIYPGIVIVIVLVSGYLRHYPDDASILQISMFAVTAPPAAIVSQLAVMYKKDAISASIYNVLSIVLCILTMPIMTAIFQGLFS